MWYRRRVHRLASTPALSALAGHVLATSVLGCGFAASAALVGCAGERAVMVEISGTAGADRLCLIASDGARVVFSRAYGDELVGAPADGTLTFVAGSDVDSAVIVTALALRAGAVIGSATGTGSFGERGTTTLPLVVSRCRRRTLSSAALVARAVVAIEAVGPGARLAAGDVDGDGRDEALILGVGGTLVTVDVERARAVANAATGAGGRIAGVGDLDGDCSLDPVVVAADGVRVLHTADDAVIVDPAVNGTAGTVDAALGAASGGPRIAVCGPAGVSLVVPRGATGAITLGTDPAQSVVVADLTGDRRAEVIAAGPGGVFVWIALDAGFVRADDALPPSFATVTTLLVVLDADGDGTPDLAGAGADALHLALNRGDGLLEDRSGAGVAFAGAVVMVALDLDGDCRDELAVLGSDGVLALYTANGALVARAETFAGVADVAAGDFDGDGARELVVLESDGQLSVVRP